MRVCVGLQRVAALGIYSEWGGYSPGSLRTKVAQLGSRSEVSRSWSSLQTLFTDFLPQKRAEFENFAQFTSRPIDQCVSWREGGSQKPVSGDATIYKKMSAPGTTNLPRRAYICRYHLCSMKRNSFLKELRVKRLKVFQEEIWCSRSSGKRDVLKTGEKLLSCQKLTHHGHVVANWSRISLSQGQSLLRTNPDYC